MKLDNNDGRILNIEETMRQVELSEQEVITFLREYTHSEIRNGKYKNGVFIPMNFSEALNLKRIKRLEKNKRFINILNKQKKD